MINLIQLKKAMKIDFTADDADLLRLLDAAVSFVESYTGISLDVKTKTDYMAYFMKLSFSGYPFISVTSVTYTSAPSLVVTTMPATDYWVDRSKDIVSLNFLEYPAMVEGTQVAVTYQYGYAKTPASLDQCVISLVAAWYNNVEATTPITLSQVPMACMWMLDNLKVRNAVMS
jgi:uncharacterized phiE125 gp8 family phage protein